MSNLLMILVAANIGYLLYALFKVKNNRTNSSKSSSLADDTVILNVPDHMLEMSAIGKTVNLKDEPVAPVENPWEKKIVRPEHRMAFRKNWDHNQLLLKDVDKNLFS